MSQRIESTLREKEQQLHCKTILKAQTWRQIFQCVVTGGIEEQTTQGSSHPSHGSLMESWADCSLQSNFKDFLCLLFKRMM